MTEFSDSPKDRALDLTTTIPPHPDHMLSQEEFTAALEKVDFPHEIIGIDVNGTLISETDPNKKHIEPEDVEPLNAAIAEKRAAGAAVILVSDSPGPQLLALGRQLGMDEGAIAENGNDIFWNNNIIVATPLLGRDELRKQIAEVASTAGLHQGKDRIAPEFPGGKFVDQHGQEWAFGANRIASVSAFGPGQLIETFRNQLIIPENISADFSPQDGFLGLHPKIDKSADFTGNKGRTLEMIAKTGRNVTMIGNAQSDWTDPATGVKSIFVAASRITDDMRERAAFIATRPLAKGVINALQMIR